MLSQVYAVVRLQVNRELLAGSDEPGLFRQSAGDLVAHVGVTAQSPLVHSCQHRYIRIHIVVKTKRTGKIDVAVIQSLYRKDEVKDSRPDPPDLLART